jgi:Domain of unknown function (DUF4252)
MPVHRSALLAVCCLLPGCAVQTHALTVSSLAAMQRDSVDSVNITLGPVALGLLRVLGPSGGHDDPHSIAEMKLFQGLHKVEVQSYHFATGHTYRQADLDALRSQFTAPGWRHIMQARDRDSDGDIDIFCTLNNHTITRLVIIAAEPREFALINIAGAIDPDQIGMIRKDLLPHKEGQSRLVPIRLKQSVSRN